MFECESSDNNCRTTNDSKVVVRLAIENWNIIFLLCNNRSHNKQSGNNTQKCQDYIYL